MDDPHDPDCVFCLDNGKVDCIRTSLSGHTYFMQVLAPQGDVMVPVEGAYFVLPVWHYKPDGRMPFDFLREVNWHMTESGLVFDNGGFNYTEPGGAKILDHAHYWLMQVKKNDPALGLHSLREYLSDLRTEGACFRACP